MTKTAFDRDDILTEFLTSYIDRTLDNIEEGVFEQYLADNPEECEFARRALEGKKVLSRLAKSVSARDDFEARLALRIALDRESESKNSVIV